MSDVLKGMTTAEARAFIAGLDPVEYPAMSPDEEQGFAGCEAHTVLCEHPQGIRILLALAALGAECVGAEEWFVGSDGDVHGEVLWRSKDETQMPKVRRVLVLPESE